MTAVPLSCEAALVPSTSRSTVSVLVLIAVINIFSESIVMISSTAKLVAEVTSIPVSLASNASARVVEAPVN